MKYADQILPSQSVCQCNAVADEKGWMDGCQAKSVVEIRVVVYVE